MKKNPTKTDLLLQEVENFNSETRKSFNSISKYLKSLVIKINEVRKRETGVGFNAGRKKENPHWMKRNKEKREQKKPNIKQILYEKQQGICNGCETPFAIRNLQTDHIKPQAKGGRDIIQNLQLLCGACNSLKGTGNMADLRKELKRKRIIGTKRNINKEVKKKANAKPSENRSSLKGIVSKNTKIRATYKGKTYEATLLPSGRVIYKNKEYRSPNEVANIIMREINPQKQTKRNALTFWKIQDTNDNWITLKELKEQS